MKTLITLVLLTIAANSYAGASDSYANNDAVQQSSDNRANDTSNGMTQMQ